MHFNKPPTTIDEQIDLLIERGMQGDAALMRRWLETVGYYRLVRMTWFGTKPSFAPASLNVGLYRKRPFCLCVPEAAEAPITLPMHSNGDVAGSASVL